MHYRKNAPAVLLKRVGFFKSGKVLLLERKQTKSPQKQNKQKTRDLKFITYPPSMFVEDKGGFAFSDHLILVSSGVGRGNFELCGLFFH